MTSMKNLLPTAPSCGCTTRTGAGGSRHRDEPGHRRRTRALAIRPNRATNRDQAKGLQGTSVAAPAEPPTLPCHQGPRPLWRLRRRGALFRRAPSVAPATPEIRRAPLEPVSGALREARRAAGRALSELQRDAAESSLALLEAPEQGLEAWLELGAHATKTSLRSNAQSGSRDTIWGVGMTLRGGPRVRMRRLTLGPYAEGLIMNVGARAGTGFGLQVGLRF
jgi:hypothetical protein